MSKLKKQPRPKAETPKGFRDYFGYELIQRQKLLNDISEVYQLYGFSALESSAVETVEALGKFFYLILIARMREYLPGRKMILGLHSGMI